MQLSRIKMFTVILVTTFVSVLSGSTCPLVGRETSIATESSLYVAPQGPACNIGAEETVKPNMPHHALHRDVCICPFPYYIVSHYAI